MQPVTDRYLEFRSENFKENKRMEELSWLKWKFNCCFLQLKKIWHLENLFWDTLYNIFSSYYPELVYAARARHAKFIHDTMSLKPMNAGSICTRWYLFIWYSHMSYDVFFPVDHACSSCSMTWKISGKLYTGLFMVFSIFFHYVHSFFKDCIYNI